MLRCGFRAVVVGTFADRLQNAFDELPKVAAQRVEDAHADVFVLADDRKEQVLGADVAVAQAHGFIGGVV